MRLIRMIGLAVVAVVAMGALSATGASAESNTALCKVDTANVCPAELLVKEVHYLDADVELLTSILNIQCHLLFAGVVTTFGLLALAPTPLAISGNLTYSNCDHNCAITMISETTTLKFLKTADELASVKPQSLVLVMCDEFIHCVYDDTGLTGHALGGLKTTASELSHITYPKSSLNKIAGLLCPSLSHLDEVLLQSLEKIYIKS